jgi:hypothetical protein
MAIPVIAAPTSILAFKQYQQWSFQPFATENPFRWQSSPLPPGMTMHTPEEFAATGVAATDVITAAGNDFANRDKVVISSITGGAGLTVDTIYFVRDKAGDTFKLAATAGGPAIDFTTDITDAIITALPTGRISGAATEAGVWDVSINAINADGTSAALVFPVGIEPATSSLHTGADLAVDLQTMLVGADGAPTEASPYPLTVKAGDEMLLYIRFKRGGTAVDLGTLGYLYFALKELEPESVVQLGGGAPTGVDGTPMVKTGTGADAVYIIAVKFDDAKIKSALSSYEDDAGTEFIGLGELTWSEPNPTTTPRVGSASLVRSSQTFFVRVVRDLKP